MRTDCGTGSRDQGSLETLGEMVRSYVEHYRVGRVAEAKRFRAMASLDAVLLDAGQARRWDGKYQSHQRRIRRASKEAFPQVLEHERAGVQVCRTFTQLRDLIWERRPPGIGALAVYDAAVRIAAYLGFEPEEVYLHAGALTGARALDLPTRRGPLAMADLPRELRELRADEVEDFLCLFKDDLRRLASRSI